MGGFFKALLRIIAIVLIIIAVVYLICALIAYAGASAALLETMLPTFLATAVPAAKAWMVFAAIGAGSLALAHVVDYDSARETMSDAVGGVAESVADIAKGAGTITGGLVKGVISATSPLLSAALPLLLGVGAWFLLRRQPASAATEGDQRSSSRQLPRQEQLQQPQQQASPAESEKSND